MKILGHYITLKGSLGWIALILIGNSIWSFIAMPGLTKCSEWLVNFISFFIHGFKDSIYSMAARSFGRMYDSGGESMIIFIVFLTGFFLMIFIRRQTEFIYECMSGDDIHGKNQLKEMQNRYRKTESGFFIALIILSITSIYFMASTAIRLDFAKQQIIIAPYITEDEEDVISAKFKMMKGKLDYIKIQEEIRAIAIANRIAQSDLKLEFVEPF